MPHNNSQDQAVHAKPFPTLWVMMGVMIAIGPLAIVMYLPALPTMADDFGVSVSEESRSVLFYFIGLVLGQLFYGPFLDRVGRVLSMHIGMTVFVVVSIICATATSEIVLFVACTVQALGACVTAVVTRAAIRDTLNPVQGGCKGVQSYGAGQGASSDTCPKFGGVDF